MKHMRYMHVVVTSGTQAIIREEFSFVRIIVLPLRNDHVTLQLLSYMSRTLPIRYSLVRCLGTTIMA
jgi:hypothetical protein